MRDVEQILNGKGAIMAKSGPEGSNGDEGAENSSLRPQAPSIPQRTRGRGAL